MNRFHRIKDCQDIRSFTCVVFLFENNWSGTLSVVKAAWEVVAWEVKFCKGKGQYHMTTTSCIHVHCIMVLL